MKELKRPLIFKPLTTEDYMKAVQETTDWIQSYEIPTERGKLWKQSPETDNNYDDEPLLSPKSLYGGSAGLGIYFLRLYDVTGEEKWLDEAKAAAAHIIADYPGARFYTDIMNAEAEGVHKIKGRKIGVYNGPVGGGFFVELLYRKTGAPEYRAFARQVADDLLTVAIHDEKGVHWSETCDIISDGSFILYLLYLYREVREQAYFDTAKAGMDYITTRAEDSPNGGKHWVAMDLASLGFDVFGNFFFPGFAHGTAGIGFMYAVFYEETKDEMYLELAKAATEYLQSIAMGDEDAALIPYLDSQAGPSQDIFYLSLCHGPVGTTLLFRKMYEVTGDESYIDWVKRLTNGIVRTGAPETKSAGYWNCHCLCCGTAGLLEHFVEVYELTGEEKYLLYAQRTANNLLGESYVDKGQRRWYDAWVRLTPSKVESYTGLYVGAAGCAYALLRLVANEKGIKPIRSYEYLFLNDENTH